MTARPEPLRPRSSSQTDLGGRRRSLCCQALTQGARFGKLILQRYATHLGRGLLRGACFARLEQHKEKEGGKRWRLIHWSGRLADVRVGGGGGVRVRSSPSTPVRSGTAVASAGGGGTHARQTVRSKGYILLRGEEVLCACGPRPR